MSKAKRNIIQFTYDVEEFIEYIQEEMTNKSFNDFALDKKSIGYIERQLEKIGEAITQIQKLDKDILTKIYDNKSYWEGIKGVRNRLIHEYWGTSIQMIYEISVDEMDELLDYIKKIRELEKN
ncbi:MAG: HepT-like ribonuclease domain-containing protein [Cetobacterium sp.]|uniref:HepT-like ribonuclease domain-containing protein n=1 Tax=Cetobacterium sp. TaxID=2071632 RepID=UPI003F3CBDEE